MNSMITFQKQDDKYCVYHNGQQLGVVKLYDNPYHATNCYVKLDMDCRDKNISTELFGELKESAGRPLQVMVESDEVSMTEFLTAGGFICKRKCYEVDACAGDYVGGVANVKLYCSSAGDPDYGQCCRMMYHYYVNSHKTINPWTADYATFCAELSGKVVYAKDRDQITSVAFVEDNEIAYVCGTDGDHFLQFAESLASFMLAEHERIFFESDDCDWAAMILKSLFANQGGASFDTYIFNGDSL